MAIVYAFGAAAAMAGALLAGVAHTAAVGVFVVLAVIFFAFAA
jgi:hypothetical protein